MTDTLTTKINSNYKNDLIARLEKISNLFQQIKELIEDFDTETSVEFFFETEDRDLREVCEQFAKRVFTSGSANPAELQAATELAELLASVSHCF